MTYKWRIDIVLKSGKEFKVAYEGNEDGSADVARNLFSNKRYSEVLSFRGTSECNQHVFVIAGEIAAFAISVA